MLGSFFTLKHCAMSHPFDPLTPGEIVLVSGTPSDLYIEQVFTFMIVQAADVVRASIAEDHEIIFRAITLSEVPKREMVEFLDRERKGQFPLPRHARVAMVLIYVGKPTANKSLRQLKVDLDHRRILDEQDLVGRHSHIDVDYMRAVEVACLEDPRIQAEIAASKLPGGATVIVEPWAYATDGMNDMKKRIAIVCLILLTLMSQPSDKLPCSVLVLHAVGGTSGFKLLCLSTRSLR